MKKPSILIITLFLIISIVGVVNAYGNISVSSVPSGATILLNGTSTGLTTPAMLENIPVGSHTVLLQLTNYQDSSQPVTVSENTTSTVSPTLTASTTAPTITSLSPATATNGGWQTIEITGTGFSSSGATASLYMSGQTNISGTATGTDSTTTISRNFNLNGVAIGTWTLYLLNSGGGTASSTFTVTNATAKTVTSISPTSGVVNNTVAVTIAGTGFEAGSAKIRLYRSGNYIGGTVNSGGTSTQLTGSFNLDQATPATYDVCVLTDGTDISKKCGPTFSVLSSTAVNGSIYFTSSPSGATVWVDNVNKGTTPFTLENVIPNSYNIKMQRASYLDWADRVTVTAGNETTVNAPLTYEAAATTATPVPTTIFVSTATLPPTTVKSSLAAPTPWPTDTPAPESPVSVLAIIGALVAGIVILGRK